MERDSEQEPEPDDVEEEGVKSRDSLLRLRERATRTVMDGRVMFLAICSRRLACTSAECFQPCSVRIHLSPGLSPPVPKSAISRINACFLGISFIYLDVEDDVID